MSNLGMQVKCNQGHYQRLIFEIFHFNFTLRKIQIKDMLLYKMYSSMWFQVYYDQTYLSKHLVCNSTWTQSSNIKVEYSNWLTRQKMAMQDPIWNQRYTCNSLTEKIKIENRLTFDIHHSTKMRTQNKLEPGNSPIHLSPVSTITITLHPLHKFQIVQRPSFD